MTPAQEAKAYALQHGFSITAEGRRYNVTRSASPNCLAHVADVGGYPAALNAMRRWVEDNAAKAVHCDVVCEDGAMGVDADRVVGQQPNAGIRPFTPQSDEQLLHEIRTLPYDALMQLIQMATGATLDKIAHAKGWAPRQPAWPDQDFRVTLLNTATTFYCEPVVANADVPGVSVATGTRLDELAKIPAFDDFNEASKARIRKAADKMRNKPKGAWYVIVEGLGEYGGFISRAEALEKLRRLFNCTIGAAYRKAKATIVYQGF